MTTAIIYDNINGVYLFDEQLQLHKQHVFSDEEREAYAQAKTANADVQEMLDKTGLHGTAPTEAQEQKILAFFHQQRIDTRSANIALTRQQIRNSVTKDQLIINTINTIEEIDKITNTLAKRLREWAALENPELEHEEREHKVFVQSAIEHLSTRTADTMGGTLSESDKAAIIREAMMIQQLYEQRELLLQYLEEAMQDSCANLKKVAGAMIGARLIAIAGSLLRLSRMPSGTIQLLGAETALFRHLRNKHARMPKHGIIFNHVMLQQTRREHRGRIARTIADKISIAAKIDYFKGEYRGDQMYQEIEERMQQENK